MSIPEHIKPGAFVRLRGGVKAEIYSTDNGGDYPVHGRIFDQDGAAHVATWSSEGWVCRYESGLSTGIVGPWIERPDYSKLWPLLPPWIRWLAMDADGELFGYPEKPNPRSTGWCTSWVFRHIWVPPSYHPPAVGDWRESLQERPAP